MRNLRNCFEILNKNFRVYFLALLLFIVTNVRFTSKQVCQLALRRITPILLTFSCIFEAAVEAH